ncbi:MAG: hypothetical protein KJZ93_08780 [Caldilineaceae bacterium]|nr:hypothetical protein [Caldilineaceae bacterium]
MITWPFSTTTTQAGAPVQPVSEEHAEAHSSDLSRVLTAAVVSRRFCNLLLNDPQAALRSGYNGETFQLSEHERNAVLTAGASSLRELAAKLLAQANDDDLTELVSTRPHRSRHSESVLGVAQFA